MVVVERPRHVGDSEDIVALRIVAGDHGLIGGGKKPGYYFLLLDRFTNLDLPVAQTTQFVYPPPLAEGARAILGIEFLNTLIVIFEDCVDLLDPVLQPALLLSAGAN